MIKRKRASLKDKSPETLGQTPRKGNKGIDLLFGGPMDQSADAFSSSELEEAQEDLSGLIIESAPSASSEVDANIAVDPSQRQDSLVDELGLPVAMEAPPDDLLLATETGSAGDQVDAFNPALSPFAMLGPIDLTSSPAEDANDLSGLQEKDKNSDVEEEKLANSVDDNDLSGLVEDNAPTADDNLVGLVVNTPAAGPADDNDLSGLVAAPPPSTAPAGGTGTSTYTPPSFSPLASDSFNDLSGLVTADEGAGSPVTPASFPSPRPEVAPSYASYAPAPTPAAVPTTPAYQPAPPPSPAPPPVVIDSFRGVAAERIPVSLEDILPQDALTKIDNQIIAVEKREMLTRDEATAEKIARYIGPERRKKLDDEIMDLYQIVADEMSDHKEDAAFALKTLREAQDIVIEDISQYDEALYRVAVVRTMLVRKKNLRQWSYTWGMFVFFYAIAWLFIFVAGIYFVDMSTVAGLSQGAAALRSAWLSSLAGGVGGVVAILYSLSWRVAIKQEFDRQYVMKYLVEPIMGFVLGAVMFFVTSAGFLVLNPTTSPSGSEGFLGGFQLVYIQILLGFIAGFRQRVVYFMIDRIVEKISPEDTSSKTPTSVVPEKDYERLSVSEGN